MDNHESIIQELFTPETKKHWHSRWWGKFLIIIGVIVLSAGAWFSSQITYYYQALKRGDAKAFEGIYIDASQYGQVGSQISRPEVETQDSPSTGPLDAKVVVVEFSDFECPYSRENAPTVRKMIEKYGDRVRFIYRDFPQEYIHPNATIASMAGQCANDQGLFWPFYDILFNQQGQYQTEDDLIALASNAGMDQEKFSSCLKSHKYEGKVSQDLQDGIRFGLRGTPTFFVNGLKLSGEVSETVFDEVLKRYLDKFGS